jgi:Zn-dependent protease with chaperone function
MDFFAAQAAARRRTAALLVWFALAFAGTALTIWAGLGGALALGFPSAAHLAFSPVLGAWVTGFVAVVTFAGSAWHRARLAAEGGHAVARMLGGVAVDRRSDDAGERRLVNVVEEMAIAAGLPVPALYVLPAETGVNAFAAGFSPDRAVIAVTRGALDTLTRDELQGVIAHELSHVVNGDARLNLQLVAIIGGITVLAAVGRLLARATGESGPRRLGRRRGGGALLAAGLVIWLAGSVGALFARIIRAAVSRQREFLADAAAVQFTRNPDGLAGALAKIGGAGSLIASAFAPEASHLFFANALASRWFATHPPLEERIRRLAPGGVLRRRAAAERTVQPAGAAAGPLGASGLVASAGSPGAAHLARAAGILAALPAEVVAAAREPGAAGALVRALLADPDPGRRAAQLRTLADGPLRADVERLVPALARVERADRIAVLDLSLAALDGLPPAAAASLLADLSALSAPTGGPRSSNGRCGASSGGGSKEAPERCGGGRSAPTRWTTCRWTSSTSSPPWAGRGAATSAAHSPPWRPGSRSSASGAGVSSRGTGSAASGSRRRSRGSKAQPRS